MAIKVASVALAAGTGVLLARTLGPSGYGSYSYVMAIATIFSVVSQLGLPTLVVREIASRVARQEWSLAKGLLVRSNQVVLGASVGLGGTAALILALAGNSGSTSDRVAPALAAVLVPLLGLSALRGAALRGLGHVVLGQLPDTVIKPLLFVVSLVAAASFIGAPITPAAAIALQVASTVGAFCVGAALLIKRLPKQLRASSASFKSPAWARSAFPLLLFGGLQIALAQMDIIVLGSLAGKDKAGVYRAVNAAADLVAFVYVAINSTLAPQLAALYAKGDLDGLRRRAPMAARAAALSALPAVALFAFAGREVLSVVYGQDFASGALALTILSIGQLLNCATGVVVSLLNMSGHEKDATLGFAIAGATNLLLDLTLVPSYGITGAAMASATGLIVWNALLAIAVYRRLGIDATILGRHAPFASHQKDLPPVADR